MLERWFSIGKFIAREPLFQGITNYMAGEDKKDFNAMLHDCKDMPKFQIITDSKNIEKYGGNKMYIAPPIDYDRIMKQIPYEKQMEN